MAARRGDLLLKQTELRKRRTGCHRNLCLDQIDAKHRLGHSVLDLQARIGFDKDKRIRP